MILLSLVAIFGLITAMIGLYLNQTTAIGVGILYLLSGLLFCIAGAIAILFKKTFDFIVCLVWQLVCTYFVKSQ